MLADKVPGWRGRVGLIMPATQTVTEPRFYAVAPEGVSFHTSRLEIGKGNTAERISYTEASVPRAAAELAQARVRCIAYLCVAGGLLRGREREEQLCREIEQSSGVPVISALLSVVEAMKEVKVSRPVVTDPYMKETEELEKRFLEGSGFAVVGVHGLEIKDAFDYGQVPPRDIYAFCRKVWHREADGLYIGCCAFDGMPVAGRLEAELGVPVVTAHTAVLWKVLRTLNIKDGVPGYGRLLQEHLS